MRGDVKETMEQKMDKLDTLSAGIVYGREAAWDKLQGRMEQKPKRKIAWPYQGAAAMLLLFVCIAIFYERPGAEVVNKIAIAPDADNAAPATASPATVQKEETESPANRPTTAIPHEKPQRKVAVTYVPEEPVVPTCEPWQPVVEPVAPAPVTTAVPVVTEMKVLHINELNQRTAKNTNATLVNTNQINLDHLSVVHINELMRQEHDARRILKENRESFVQFPFPHRSTSDQPDTEAGNYTPPNNILKLKLHPQN